MVITSGIAAKILATFKDEKRFSIQGHKLHIKDQSLHFSQFKSLTEHKQHRSYWLEFEKKTSMPRLVVLVDPGHGGADPGAIHGKTLEKTITLSIAQKLKKHLSDKASIQTLLTRTGDKFLSLKERLYIAQRLKPDIFLSLHADSYPDKAISGASVFIWGDKKRPDRLRKHLLSCNDDLSYLGVQHTTDEDTLYPLLNHLVQKVSYHNAQRLSETLLNKLSKIQPLHASAPQQAPFYVISPGSYPSCLVEMGFLSHKETAKSFAREDYQQRIAKNLAQGVQAYLDQVSPQKSHKLVTYTVKKGDTLWRIAHAHKVDVKTLKKANALSSDSIAQGQALKIPS